MTAHVMIDIETLSTDPYATVVSIGAVADFGLEFYTRPNMDEQIRAGRHIKADTVAWWMTQSDAARDVYKTPEVPVLEALYGLRYFIQAVKMIHKTSHVLVWAKPPSFDCVILKTLYESVREECPWGFRDERDLRTLIWTFPEVMPPEDSGTAHNALDDAKYQMQHLKMLLAAQDSKRRSHFLHIGDHVRSRNSNLFGSVFAIDGDQITVAHAATTDEEAGRTRFHVDDLERIYMEDVK